MSIPKPSRVPPAAHDSAPRYGADAAEPRVGFVTVQKPLTPDGVVQSILKSLAAGEIHGVSMSMVYVVPASSVTNNASSACNVAELFTVSSALFNATFVPSS